ncbi:hypothetical protein SAMN05444920_104741 [Nonomuraea solani]|uniref:Uncharacterized protein n=1 Tax=Nonomuraea solani TaxID=1144553 RepID=A0A1H6D324_9ACTN|nr:CU044_5270 family protein [Nonomuraea solani]SEG79712.1 hypothetical protein SAMN05444920_104741 [Nonomuraea solani]
MNDRVFARLKPSELDELAEDGYRRRRAGDLARAFAEPRTVVRRSRRPYLLMAGTLAAGLAAAAAVVVVSGDPAPRQSPLVAVETPSKTAKPVVNARMFLLAAATTAKREPAASGRYWYVNERTLQKIHNVPGEYMAGIKAADDEFRKKEKEVRNDPKALADLKKEFGDKLTKLKMAELPYTAFAADTREIWRPMKAGETGRTVGNQDVEVSFGSPRDEAAWTAAGSPELVEKGARTYDDDTERVLSIDNPSLNLRNIKDLPTGKKELQRRLDALWEQSPNTAKVTSKNGYLWQTGVDLMTAPLKPGTRSALFQVLADQPGITSQGQVTDALGRTGVALSANTAHTLTLRLVIDPETAELLEYDVLEKGKPLLRVALADMGFTDELGRRPQG